MLPSPRCSTSILGAANNRVGSRSTADFCIIDTPRSRACERELAGSDSFKSLRPAINGTIPNRMCDIAKDSEFRITELKRSGRMTAQ